MSKLAESFVEELRQAVGRDNVLTDPADRLSQFFDEDTPLELIKVIRPEHLVKGGDWAPENIVGAEFLKTYGGQTHAIPIRYERSTTELIDRIRRYE